MKKEGFVLILGVFLLTGCMDSETLRLENQKNLLKISIGMTKQEVIKIMGDKSASPKFRGAFQHRLPAANNPYRTETLKTDDKTYEVVYYLTDNKSDDGAITDDELTPMFFENGVLVGWGQNFLRENIGKYEIRVR
jgi:hypothetical protein